MKCAGVKRRVFAEDEDETLDEDQNEDVDPLVNLLFDQIALLKTQVRYPALTFHTC